jgi:hypothetical protein
MKRKRLCTFRSGHARAIVYRSTGLGLLSPVRYSLELRHDARGGSHQILLCGSGELQNLVDAIDAAHRLIAEHLLVGEPFEEWCEYHGLDSDDPEVGV